MNKDYVDKQITMRPENIFHTGAILTGDQINEEIRLGNIEISGFDPARLNENSYNVTLSPTIMTYDLKATDDYILDVKNPPALISATITDKYGYVIHPEKFYLGSTNETIHSDLFVPIMAGRSSFGRLGFPSILPVTSVTLAILVPGLFRLSRCSRLVSIRILKLPRSTS